MGLPHWCKKLRFSSVGFRKPKKVGKHCSKSRLKGGAAEM